MDDNKYLYANLANKHCLLMIEDLGGRVVQAGSTNEFPWKRRDRLWDPGNGREGRKGEKSGIEGRGEDSDRFVKISEAGSRPFREEC